jgi:hypothetical protein
MRSRRPIDDLVHPDQEAVAADDPDSDNGPDPESEHGEGQQLPPALLPELSASIRDLSHNASPELPTLLV